MGRRDEFGFAREQIAVNLAARKSGLHQTSESAIRRAIWGGLVTGLVLLGLMPAPRAHAQEPVALDCEFFSGYLYSLANMRDQGKTEDEVLASIDKRMDPRIQKHLERVVSHYLFTYRNEFSKQAVASGYLRECKAKSGRMVENAED